MSNRFRLHWFLKAKKRTRDPNQPQSSLAGTLSGWTHLVRKKQLPLHRSRLSLWSLPEKSRLEHSDFWMDTLRIFRMSWGVKTICFEAPGVSFAGSGVYIGGFRILRVAIVVPSTVHPFTPLQLLSRWNMARLSSVFTDLLVVWWLAGCLRILGKSP